MARRPEWGPTLCALHLGFTEVAPAPGGGRLIATILVVDADPRVRAHVRHLLISCGLASSVAEAEDGAGALLLLDQARPEVVVVDMIMPGMNGLVLTRRVKEAHPGVEVIVIALHDSGEFVNSAMGAGAKGYVLKERISDDLSAAVRAVRRGETYVPGGRDSAFAPVNLRQGPISRSAADVEQ